MKRLLTIILCLVTALCAFAFTACGESKSALNIVGSLHDLYSSQNGYPQAVIVAKNSVIESNEGRLKELLDTFEQNASWLTSQTTSKTDVVNAVISAFDDADTIPTFNAQNLSNSVIENCAIRFSDAQQSKSAVLSYLQKLNDISSNAWGTPVDDFFCTLSSSGAQNQANLKLFVPDGAPALSVARLIHNKTIIENLEIKVVSANLIKACVTGESPVADVCILPINLASKFLGSAASYKMLGVVTNGNIFIMKNGQGENITTQNLSILVGKKVGVINLSNVPGLTFKAILKDNGLNWTENGDIDHTKVNLIALSGGQEVVSTSECDYFIVAEPVATMKQNSSKL